MIAADDAPQLVDRINSLRDADAPVEAIRSNILRFVESHPDHPEVLLLKADSVDIAATVTSLMDGSRRRYWKGRPEGEEVAAALSAAVAGGFGSKFSKALRQERHEPPAAIPPYVPFPVDALPDPIETFIMETATAINCDPAFVALPLLAALAAAIGNSRRLRIKQTWSEPSVLWCVAVAPSGALKTPPFNAAVEPLRRVQRRAMDEFKVAMATYEKEKLLHDTALSAWRKDPKGDPPTAPQKPTPWRILVADTTMEALARLHSENPRGLFLARDELSGWLGDFDRYTRGGGDVAHWLEMHRAGFLVVDRKTGDKPTVSVEHAAVSVAGTIQPGVLAHALGSEHFVNGLAARFLVAMPPVLPRVWTEATVRKEIATAVDHVFDRLVSLSMEQGQPVDVDLSTTGRERWIAFFMRHATELARLTGDLAAAWSKLEGYCARLALLVHEVRVAAGDATVGTEVDDRDIENAARLIDWFGGETKRVYRVLDEGQDETAQRELLDLIWKHGGSVTVREVTHSSRRFRSDPAAAERALQTMVDAGLADWVEQPPGPTGGRPTRVVRLREVSPKPEPPQQPSDTSTLSPKPSAIPGDATGFGFGDAPKHGPPLGAGDGKVNGEIKSEEVNGSVIFDIGEEPKS